uniref:Secreted protein n=1 Tax=Parascaris equorum TaxID=6256 RepID=A0A914RKJ3_PAREQ
MRIPWQTLDLFPSVTVLNVFWFANTHLFATSYTLDGRWVALNQVHAIVLKRTNLKPVQAVEKACPRIYLILAEISFKGVF